MLLALLSLGVKNIHLGPTLPAFLSPRVAQLLVDTFGIAGIGTVIKARAPDVEVIGVEPERAACLAAALAHGGPTTVSLAPTLAG